MEITWDETDHERVTAMNRKFNKEELLQMDFNAYLASSSEEEDQEEEEEEGEGLIEMKVQEKELPKGMNRTHLTVKGSICNMTCCLFPIVCCVYCMFTFCL